MKRDHPETTTIQTTAGSAGLAEVAAAKGQTFVNEAAELSAVLDKVTGMEYLLGEFVCGICQKEMSKSVKILCAECGLQLCLECFANGKEKDAHKKTHDYFVLDRLQSPLYDPQWTAYEELMLMKGSLLRITLSIGVEKFGIDNWVEIADFLSTKSAAACEVHYYAFYYRSQSQKAPTPDLIIRHRLPNGTFALDEGKVAATAEAIKVSAEKQREKCGQNEQTAPAPPMEGSKGLKPADDQPAGDVLGYMPLRGDFNVEYDNDAELILADMEFCEDEKQSDSELKYEVLRQYNAKLDERIRRKKFIIDHGLLDAKSILQQEQKLSKEEREACALLRPFQRFCVGDEFKRLAEGLIQEVYLQQRIDELKRFKYHFWLRHNRAMGLNTFEQIEKYLETNNSEEDSPTKQLQAESSVAPSKLDASDHKTVVKEDKSCAELKEAPAALTLTAVPAKVEENKVAGGMWEEIKKAPGFGELSEEEQQLCKEQELLPKIYQAFKGKLQQRASSSRKSIRRVAALEFVDKIVTKNKALEIFDFMVNRDLLYAANHQLHFTKVYVAVHVGTRYHSNESNTISDSCANGQ